MMRELPFEQSPLKKLVERADHVTSSNWDMPVTVETLGLQPGYQDRYIPKMAALRGAAIQALDRETAFMVLHHDQPPKIIERLDKLADVTRAACLIQGEHQAKAVRLGLELLPRYWLVANKIDAWFDLLIALLHAALKLEDAELQSRVYHSFSIFLQFCRKKPYAMHIMLDNAVQYARECGREDLRLLLRVEAFHTHALTMSFVEAKAEADNILGEARRLKYAFVQGMAYVSLARNCWARHLFVQSFAYAQQALAVSVPLNALGQVGKAVMIMLTNLIQMNDQPAYRAQLLDYLEKLSHRTAIPFLPAHLAFFQARDCYLAGDCERARQFILEAWCQYHTAHYRRGLKRCTHVLGLIQSKRRQWKTAERHLDSAYRYYTDAGEQTYAVDAYYALACVLYQQGDLERARPLLVEAQAMARQLPEVQVRDRMLSAIQADIDDIDCRTDDALSNRVH